MIFKASVLNVTKGRYAVILQIDVSNPEVRAMFPVIEIPCEGYEHARAITDTYNNPPKVSA